MSSAGISSVDSYVAAIRGLLDKARDVKPDSDVEPALVATDFGSKIEEVGAQGQNLTTSSNQAHYAAIETAFRNIFYELLASTSIDGSSFCSVWNLLDIVSILSDNEKCEPGLVFWLVEELLDSQTIDGCRRVFDYLDSRRERMTAKHFKSKHLIILRACNELLRRLSRAEDTVFCGRVFIFLFQSFPLGDRSSVNLRGEYHIDNVTVYESLPANATQAPDHMEIDTDPKASAAQSDGTPVPSSVGQKPTDGVDQSDQEGKTIKVAAKDGNDGKASLSMDALYPIFWSLQENFSTPTRLFEPSNLQDFKQGLDVTLAKFQEMHRELETRGSGKIVDENKRGAKRKRNESAEELSSSFNPKYLTSRDLFDLEVSDLAFRRHILVQTLIVVDFLLSLTPKAKRKLESLGNKSVLYGYTLEEEDAKWANRVRTEIATYLQQGVEGKFYFRMVDTVLSRDKNWVRWKAENCPLIGRSPVSPQDFLQARDGAQKACVNKRLRATPLGSLDLAFLSNGETSDGLEKLKDLERYTIPTVESFRSGITEDEFDIDMAKTDEDKRLATSARFSKMWRALRITSKSKLNLLDRIDDGNNLQALFESADDENRSKKDGDMGDGKQAESIQLDPAQDGMGQNEVEIETPQDVAIK